MTKGILYQSVLFMLKENPEKRQTFSGVKEKLVIGIITEIFSDKMLI